VKRMNQTTISPLEQRVMERRKRSATQAGRSDSKATFPQYLEAKIRSNKDIHYQTNPVSKKKQARRQLVQVRRLTSGLRSQSSGSAGANFNSARDCTPNTATKQSSMLWMKPHRASSIAGNSSLPKAAMINNFGTPSETLASSELAPVLLLRNNAGKP